LPFGVEFQEGAAASPGPLGSALWPDQFLPDQIIGNTHDRGETNLKPFGDGITGNRSFASNNLKNGRAVDTAHILRRDRTGVIHKIYTWEDVNLHTEYNTYTQCVSYLDQIITLILKMSMGGLIVLFFAEYKYKAGYYQDKK